MQRQKKFLQLWLALVFLLTLALTACGEEADSTPQATTSAGATKAAGGSIAPAVGSSSQPSSTIGGLPYDCARVFCFGLAQEPAAFLDGRGYFDPANLVDRSSLQIARQIYDTLFEYKPGSMQYLNSSIIKFVDVSEDGLTYVIRLGKGLRFSDNTPLDAEAVRFNFERWSNPGSIYHKGSFQTYEEYFGGFPGRLVSVTVDKESNSLQIRLAEPMASFFQVLSMPQFGIVAPSAFSPRTGEIERPVGSGWYALERIPGSEERYVQRGEQKYVVLRENKLYHAERYDVKNPETQFVKSPLIVAYVLKQNQDGLQELKRGAIAATDKIRPEQTPDIAKDPSLKLLERKPLSTAFLGMNLTRPPFNNIAVRQAFAAALDTRSLVRDYYFGLGIPAGGLLPPTALAYQEYMPYTYEPERARRLLEFAGYNSSNPLRLDLWVLPVPRSYYPDPRKIALAIAADLAKVGVVINVRDSYSWPDFRRARQDGSFDFYMYGWQGQNGDPDEFLGEFYGKQRGEGGYENLALQRLVKIGAVTPDLRQRRQPYKQALDTIYQEVLVLPLAYGQSVVAVRSNVQGYLTSPNGIEDWHTVELVGTTASK